MEHADFVHLHVHSQFSLLDGMLKIPELVKKAAEYKMPAVAITDHGAMYGAVQFYEAALNEGVKPIIGCETYVAPGRRDEKSPGRNGDSNYHLILLVKNRVGYKNLCQLVTRAQFEGFYRKPRIDRELLEQYNEGLIATSACIKGQIPALLLAGRDKEAREVADFHKELMGDRFFIELQVNGLPQQEKANTKLIEMARSMDIPLVATNDCHYPERADAYAHETLLCIQIRKTMSDPSRMRFGTDEFYFKSPREMKTLFKDMPEAVANSMEIAERCNLDLELGKFHFPKFEVAEGETLDSRLDEEVKKGFDRRLEIIRRARPDFTEKDEKAYRERLDFELGVIKQMKFSSYFLIVSDFINWARKKNIPVGPGRGSAAGSLLAYSLGITDLDPMQYGLLFERFLNPERISMPDIDVDFDKGRRDDVFQYVCDKYGGNDYVSQIVSFQPLKAKNAIRDGGRALDIPYAEADRVAKLIPDTPNITLEDALKMEPELTKLRADDKRVDELLNLAAQIEGLGRHSSTHASAVVISDKPLLEYLPLAMGANGETITQYDMNCVEKIGLIKFDFLGLKTLTVIRHATELVEKTTGRKMDMRNLTFDDPSAWKLFREGKTVGVFQFESEGMRDLLVKMKPSRFEDIMAAVALYRPGPMDMLDEFIQRKLGKIEVKYIHPDLKPILEETHGIMLYQEQVMQIAQSLAGYSKGEADVLRKAMGKKNPVVMEAQREKFVAGALKNKVTEKKATKTFDHMAKFGGYGFNKSHSAAYALVAYRTAYLKANYPTEFMAALLSSEMDKNENVVKYINECREMGIEIKPPDINKSELEFSVQEGAIRFGLKAVKNVGQLAIEAILESRKEKGPYKDLFDLATRVDTRRVNKKVVESLVKCGALDSTGHKRGGMLDIIESAIAEGQRAQKERESGQTNLFGADDQLAPSTNQSIPARMLPENELLQYEKESLGFFITGHPLAKYEKMMKKFATLTTEQAPFAQDGSQVRIAGIVSEIKEMRNKRGELMAFATLEDLNGFIEVIVWADQYGEARQLLKSDSPVLVIGKLESRSDKPKILSEKVIPLDEAPSLLCSRLHLRVQTAGLTRESLVELRRLLANHPGKCPVVLHMVVGGRSEAVAPLPDRFKVAPGEELCRAIEELLGQNVTVLEAA